MGKLPTKREKDTDSEIPKAKTVSVQPLMPSKKLSNNNVVSIGINGDSPTEKTKPGSIHEILEQMQVSAESKESKLGKMAAARWQERSIRQVYDDFCNETSFTAITRIHKAEHLYKRIAWLVVCIAMMTWLTIQCYWLFEKYFSFPIEVKIEVNSVPKLDFPSVTICNLNPLVKDRMRMGPFEDIQDILELDDNDMLYDDYLNDLKDSFWNSAENDDRVGMSGMGPVYDDEYFLNQMRTKEYNKWDALENDTAMAESFYSSMDSSHTAALTYSMVAVSYNESARKWFGHDEEDMIISCSWLGKQCSPDNFTYIWNNIYGNCYTINSFDNGHPSLATNYAGPLMGLTLELNVEQHKYVSALSNSAGIRVLVHKRGTYPFPEDEGFSIAPGMMTSVGITKTDLIRLPPPHAQCGSSGNGITDIYAEDFGTIYSKQTCLKSCYQKIIFEKCGCVMSLYHVREDQPVCAWDDNATACMVDCNEVLTACGDKCPTPCQETKYDYTISMSKWPSDEYEGHLMSKISKSNSHFMDSDKRSGSEDTLAKLEIYFKELIFEKIEQQKAYESQNLISDIGGQLGLWLGLSAITVGEIVELIASICNLLSQKFCKKKGGNLPKPDLTKVKPMDA